MIPTSSSNEEPFLSPEASSCNLQGVWPPTGEWFGDVVWLGFDNPFGCECPFRTPEGRPLYSPNTDLAVIVTNLTALSLISAARLKSGSFSNASLG